MLQYGLPFAEKSQYSGVMTSSAQRVQHHSEPPQSGRQPRVQCSSCGNYDVRRSQSRGLVDAMARTLGFKPYRCRGCRSRFFAKPLG